MFRRKGRLALALLGISLVLPTAVSAEVLDDTTSPDISCAAADTAWHADNVSIACSATDADSGLADSADASFNLSTAVAAGEETGDAQTDTRNVCDVAGNCALAGPIGSNMIDKARPQTSLSMSHHANRWSRDRTIRAFFSSLDDGSGVDGFSFSWNHRATRAPDKAKDLEESAAQTTSSTLANGKWYFHLRTRDNVGNWTITQTRGPFLIDGTRPRVDAHAASGKINNSIQLRYQTADNTGKTRERLTITRSGNVIRTWSRSMARATWTTVQSVSWSPSRAGSYRFCSHGWDRAGNTRLDCAGVTVTKPVQQCHPSYKGQCLKPNASDYDCAGGSGNGPYYVYGTVIVVGPDVFGLDADHDGIGCE